MEIIKFNYSKLVQSKFIQKKWAFLVLGFLGTLIVLPLLQPGFFSHHDDLHVMRVYQMRRCLEDFQIPCRWVPDMGQGYGFPLFNYYGVFPYYIGAFLSFLVGYIWATKMLFFIPLFFGGFFMYFLGKELFGPKAGLLAAVLFSLAPFRAVDSYVRGAVSESFAIAIVPLVFLFLLKIIKEKSNLNLVLLAITLGVFLLNHNVMTIFFLPIFVLWVIFLAYYYKKLNLKNLLAGIGLGFAISAFFILPAYFEKDLVQIDNLKSGTNNFRAHFATFFQLFFSRFWGYGPSVYGNDDLMSFQIGWLHTILSFIAGGFSLLVFFHYKFVNNYLLKYPFFTKSENFYKKSKIGLLLFFIFMLSVFMIHNKSSFFWERIQIIHFAQFPWRFLSVVIFTSSLLGGLFLTFFNPKIQEKLLTGLVILSVFLNISYFKPEKYDFGMTDQKKLSSEQFLVQQKAAIGDYLPKTVKEVPGKPSENIAQVLTGDGAIIKNEKKGTNKLVLELSAKEPTVLRINQFYFPNWVVKVNSNRADIEYTDNLEGLMIIKLDKGEYKVEAILENTPIRTLSNIISLVGIFITAVLILKLNANTKKYFL